MYTEDPFHTDINSYFHRVQKWGHILWKIPVGAWFQLCRLFLQFQDMKHTMLVVTASGTILYVSPKILNMTGFHQVRQYQA